MKTKKILVWKELSQHANAMKLPEKSLKNLITEKERLEKFSAYGSELFFDFSRQRVDDETMDLLLELAETKQLQKQFNSMMSGEKVNITEKRAALHTAARHFSDEPIMLDNRNLVSEFSAVRDQIKEFSEKIHAVEITGDTDKPFKHIVVIGIGGSYLGTEFVSCALEFYANKGMKLHFLSNVDINDFSRITRKIDPETTLWVVISKSYTTAETLANETQAREYMKAKSLNPAKHFVAVTGKGSPGDHPSNPVLEVFHMFDYIGGRYSVTSSVGGVPLSLYLGYDIFERFLKGAHEMDMHAAKAPPDRNLPLITALISIWNIDFLGYRNSAVIPYAAPLRRLASHIQQLSMESNGKSVTKNGELLDVPTGAIIFGEPGTNAQHSFFQLAHQGTPFPIEFIGVINPDDDQFKSKSKGVTNHQELWANLISQPAALAKGNASENTAKNFSGNRPSSTIILNDLSPENVGRLLSFYEAKTVFEAFIWGINPFDQFGVELGKKLAKGIRNEMATKNENNDYKFDKANPIAKFYLKTLFTGKLEK